MLCRSPGVMNGPEPCSVLLFLFGRSRTLLSSPASAGSQVPGAAQSPLVCGAHARWLWKASW